MSRPALCICGPIRSSTGIITRSPRKASAIGHCIGRAAEYWAAPARSTACSMSAAIPPIMTVGRRWAAGWTYTDVLPYFKKSERYTPGDAQYRGKSGPLLVEDYRTILPLTHRFVEAAQLAGFPLTRDYNGAVQEGVGYSQMTRNGRFRGSTARTFPSRLACRPK